MTSIAIASDISNIPQHDIGNSSGPDSSQEAQKALTSGMLSKTYVSQGQGGYCLGTAYDLHYGASKLYMRSFDNHGSCRDSSF